MRGVPLVGRNSEPTLELFDADANQNPGRLQPLHSVARICFFGFIPGRAKTRILPKLLVVNGERRV